MEKSRQKNNKTNQTKYPAPNSRSWAGRVPRKTTPLLRCANKSCCSNAAPPLQTGYSRGLDPTVPHLKYGIFPKKTLVNREHNSHLINPNHSDRMVSQTSDTKNERIMSPDRNPHNAQGEFSECPMFMFRTLPHKRMKKLMISASSHLDIKPKPIYSQGNRQHI